MYLGLDLGTSGLRGLLIDADQNVVASAEATYEVSHPHSGWSEQDPEDWIAALDAVMATLKSANRSALASLNGIGVSGHMHGATCLGADGHVLRPCILWNDTRSHVEAAALDQLENTRELSGNIVFPGFTAPKLAWMATHEPQIFAQIDKVLLPKDYLNFILTGDAVGDMSDSAGTAWLDTGKREWSETLLSAGQMAASNMPRLVEGSQKAGTLKPELAAKWGVPDTCVIAGGAGDNAAAACGVGAMVEGDGFVSLGTSGVLLSAKDSYSPQPASAVHTFCHAVPNRWYQMGVILAATDSLNWLSGITGKTPAELTSELGDALTTPTDVMFAPYLSGERTPHNDSAIRGAFTGLSVSTSRSDMTQAVLQGVCFALRDSLEALKSTGTNMTSALAIGGGTGSTLWVEMLATVLDLPLEIPAEGEFGAALGAARLALTASTGSDPMSIMTKPDIARTIQPNTDHKAAYDAAYERYTQLYPTLKALT